MKQSIEHRTHLGKAKTNIHAIVQHAGVQLGSSWNWGKLHVQVVLVCEIKMATEPPSNS